MRRYSQFGVTPARDLRLPGVGGPSAGMATVVPKRRRMLGFTQNLEQTLQGVGSSNSTGFTLTADPGSITWTGTDATLTLAGSATLTALSGAFIIVGAEAGLHWSGENPHRLPSFPRARTDGNGYLEITLSLAKGSDGPLTPLGHLDVHVDSSGRLLCVKGN